MTLFYKALVLLPISLAAVPQRSALADIRSAAAALNEGRADDATRLLEAQLASSPQDAAAHQLLCRVFYSQELADPAIHECEAAVAELSSSDNSLWLGRAYGMKASRANPVLAYVLAKKVAAAFERAVELDPLNVQALSDLGEFYVAAPSLVGGGLDKAQQLAARMMPVSVSKAHRLLALIAEKRGDMAAAESEFKRAVEARRSAETLVDLGDYYRRTKQFNQAFTAVQAAMRLDKPRDAAIVDVATILISTDHSPQLAQQLLSEYLVSPAKSDEAPAARVHVQLGDLLLKAGDRGRAREEYQNALVLASKYAPARKALQAL